jgi:hypothetical protein
VKEQLGGPSVSTPGAFCPAGKKIAEAIADQHNKEQSKNNIVQNKIAQLCNLQRKNLVEKISRKRKQQSILHTSTRDSRGQIFPSDIIVHDVGV